MIKSFNILSYRQEIRNSIRQCRKKINANQQLRFAKEAAKRMMSWTPTIIGSNIALFFSFDGEIDTKILINQLFHIGKKIYLPALHPLKKDTLLFLQYHPYTKLVLNRFKILEPPFNVHDILSLNNLDLMIIPLVAFDKKGKRLGMGGGFYDRVLQNKEKYNFQLVGYAYDCQLIDSLPTERWDIKLPAIITPSRLWIW